MASQNQEEARKAMSALKEKPKQVDELSLSQLIDVGAHCGWLGRDVRKLGQAVRDYRNYVHPREQLRQKDAPDEDTSRICWQVVQAAMNDLAKAKRA